MNNNGNSAFWRDVLDYVPYVTLLFLIEEDESAHLIFANREVQKQLSYQPQDYVLEGESDSGVRDDLSRLTDRIVRLDPENPPLEHRRCSLHDRQGNLRWYTFDFRLFQTRVGGTGMILVLLTPDSGPASDPAAPLPDKFFWNETIWQSEVMQSILDKILEHPVREGNLLIRGEKGTGRHTLARYLSARLSSGEDEVCAIRLAADGETQRGQLFGTENPAEKPKWEESSSLCVVLSDVADLSTSNIQQLAGRIRQRREKKRFTRIIAVSQAPMETIVDRLGSFYYELNFYPVLMPPLKHRKEDVRLISRQWLRRAAKIVGIERLEIPGEELDKLESYEWPGQFPELFTVLRRALFSEEDGVVRIKTNPLKKGTRKEASGVLPFDEMNRRYLEKVLEITGGRIYGKDGAAELLGLKPTTLQSKLKKLGVK